MSRFNIEMLYRVRVAVEVSAECEQDAIQAVLRHEGDTCDPEALEPVIERVRLLE